MTLFLLSTPNSPSPNFFLLFCSVFFSLFSRSIFVVLDDFPRFCLIYCIPSGFVAFFRPFSSSPPLYRGIFSPTFLPFFLFESGSRLGHRFFSCVLLIRCSFFSLFVVSRLLVASSSPWTFLTLTPPRSTAPVLFPLS